ncbi:MAG: hypothetical protein E7441_09595 [Ruminococcaceae bacterium]|nr:hypothetical protein [Oscillospiraceae bacterium]
MKKLISILICAAMILSLIPAVAATGDATLEYVFTSTAQGGSGTVTPTKDEFYGYAVEGEKWQFVNMVSYSACALYSTHLNWGFATSGKPEYDGEDKMTGAYAIELDIPTAGVYTPTLEYRAYKAGATAEVYLVEKSKFEAGTSGEYYFSYDPEATDKGGYDNEENAERREAFISAVNAMSANDRLGTVNTCSEEVAEYQPKIFRDIEIEKAGPYILAIVPTGAQMQSGDNKYSIQLHSFKLDKVVENTAVEQEFTITTDGETEDCGWEVASSAGYNAVGSLLATGFRQTFRVKWLISRSYHVMLRLNVKTAGKYMLQIKSAPGDSTSEIFNMGVHWLKDEKSEKTAVELVGGNDRLTHSSFVGSCDFDDAKSGYQDVAQITIKEPGDYLIAFFGNSNTEFSPGAYDADEKPQVYLSGIKLVPVEHVNVETDAAAAERENIQNENGGNLSAEADKVPLNANINALTMFGDEVKKDTVTAGTEVTVTAPDKTGYSFLYWAKGLTDKKVIVSDKKSYTFTAVRENNPLIAVYTSDTAKADIEFYNGNFQLLDATLDAENKLPPLPTEGIAGYGEATHWELFGDDKEYAPGDVISPSGKMIFVAQYDELVKDIEVTVNGNVKMCSYGELVTETAPARSESDVFNYWLRDGQIVGFGKTYSFYAYEDCELTAVYKEYEPINKTLRKIILDTMEDGRLMAEFIGFGDAAEKGIMIKQENSNDDGKLSVCALQ